MLNDNDAKQMASEQMKRMDQKRLVEMQLRAQAHMQKKFRRDQRDDVKLVGARQYKKLVKQARRDAKATHSAAE